ncbi:right-handed parallel beta-helix repeat-containing protein [Roseovarius arcticus]|uniref:right-handed parallel beta-helix repeat-containing protein n=1 Tax=Roseovarius arcticus TaxID=2547404 RepID=UPI00111016BD|nr:right-handed parallel beta-helix repeat-containing protein [Roseovarius arcticus]
MHMPNAFAKALPLAGLLLLLVPIPAAAAPACSGVSTGSTAQKDDAIGNAADLSAALKRAEGGEVFLLAAGDYGALTLKKEFSSPMTIRSANAKASACYTELRLNGGENIVLDGLVFDYAYTEGDRNSANRFSIVQSRAITITNSIFDGGDNRGAGSGRGLRIKDSSAIEIGNSVFRKWCKALTGGNSSNLTLSGNEFTDIRSDGIALGGAQRLRIEGNRLHNFRGVEGGKDRRDMVQIMRASNQRGTNIVIRDNIFDMGAGDYAQTIWMGGVGKIAGCKNQRDWAILNNAIIQDTSPSSPGFYDREFTYYTSGRTNEYNEYRVRPGSTIDRLDAGLTLTKSYPTRR